MMTRNSPAAFLNPFALWTDLALKTNEMLFSSAQVIGTRVNRMSNAGPRLSERDRREFTLMGSEKLKAATESSLAVANRLQSANYELVMRAWQQWFATLAAMGSLGRSRTMGEVMMRQGRLTQSLMRSAHSHSHMSSDAARLASAALKPAHSAATANARRLARVKNTRSRA